MLVAPFLVEDVDGATVAPPENAFIMAVNIPM